MAESRFVWLAAAVHHRRLLKLSLAALLAVGPWIVTRNALAVEDSEPLAIDDDDASPPADAKDAKDVVKKEPTKKSSKMSGKLKKKVTPKKKAATAAKKPKKKVASKPSKKATKTAKSKDAPKDKSSDKTASADPKEKKTFSLSKKRKR